MENTKSENNLFNFCIKPETETLEHVFTSCNSPQETRNIMIESSVKKLRALINVNKNKEQIIFCLGLTPYDDGNAINMNAFEYLAEGNRKIWNSRHDIVFEKVDRKTKITEIERKIKVFSDSFYNKRIVQKNNLKCKGR